MHLGTVGAAIGFSYFSKGQHFIDLSAEETVRQYLHLCHIDLMGSVSSIKRKNRIGQCHCILFRILFVAYHIILRPAKCI